MFFPTSLSRACFTGTAALMISCPVLISSHVPYSLHVFKRADCIVAVPTHAKIQQKEEKNTILAKIQ